jgi:cytoskeletal protein CcmA (bactofilin family)
MLRSETLFGKREPSTPAPSTSNTPATTASMMSAGGASLTKPLAPVNTASDTTSASASTNEVGSKLIVGPNIKLKGVEITDCDTLVVEGRVEATMDSRVIQIAEKGSFKGSAGIDIAEIRGQFDGELTVREKLVIYSTGKVSGKIRYGKVVIEEGGQLTGEVQSVAAGEVRGLVAVPKAGQQ